MKGQGWKNESHRHRMAGMGIKSGNKSINISTKNKTHKFANSLPFWNKKEIKEFEDRFGKITGVDDERYGEYRIEINNKEYRVFKSFDIAETTAIMEVKEDLEDDPGLFSSSWLESHLDLEAMLDILVDDYDELTFGEPAIDWFNEDEIREALDLKEIEPIADINMDDLQGTDLYDARAKERAEDIVYNGADRNIYFPSDVIRSYLDIDSASEEAVMIDGVGHFLAGYDGDEHNIRDAYIYRIN